MTLIIKDRQVVEDDWFVLRAVAGEGEAAALPEPAALLQQTAARKWLVPLSYWKTYGKALTGAGGAAALSVGVWLAPDDEPGDVADELNALQLLAVDFPVFRDGRGISSARLLRERYGWTGEIRAIGDVQRDQIGYMSRCGINAFAVRADKDIHDALKAFDELTVHYQGDANEPRPLFRRINRLAAGEIDAVAPVARPASAS